MEEEVKKKVDESWKKQTEKEKSQTQETHQQFDEPSFTVLVSSLSMQAMICLGKIGSPLSGKKEENLEQARFLIDTLGILKDKTKANLDQEEEHFLEESLFQLRMNYVEVKNLKEKAL